MKIDFGGRTWEVDTAKITLAQAMVITGRLGCSISAFERLLADVENLQWLPAMQCLYWLMLQQDGQQLPLDHEDVTGFEIVTYSVAFAEAIEREMAAAQPEDPTRLPATNGGAPAEAVPTPALADG